jgi:hypothetical protein
MATLASVGLVKSSSASSGSFDALQRASTPGRQVPTSPKSSSGRLDQDAFLSEKSGAEDGARSMAASSDGAEKALSGLDRGHMSLDHLDAELGVEELIRKLPDVLFPFDGDDEGEALTPFTAVYGSPGVGREMFASRPPRDRRELGGGGLSPGAADFLPFGSAPASSHRQSHGFGGRDGRQSASPTKGSPPSFAFGSPPGEAFSETGGDPNGAKYTPPNRRVSLGSHEPFPPKSRRVRAPHPVPVKKNPAPGFNGAGFRSAREIYVGKVHEFLCARAAFGAPWVRVTGKDSVHLLVEKPLTIPENYLQFFKDHSVAFELSPCARYVAAKMPGEEHACIPPPPGASSTSTASESGNASLSSSVGSDDGFVLAGKRRERRSSASGSPPVHRLCAYVSKPGGCRAGDACRFSHAT